MSTSPDALAWSGIAFVALFALWKMQVAPLVERIRAAAA